MLRKRGLALLLLAGSPGVALAHTPHVCPPEIVDTPRMAFHEEQSNLVNLDFKEIFQRGGGLGEVRFNECDGQGRPESTGNDQKREPGQPSMIRTSGPEGTACNGCHAQPRAGGAGDFVANTFNGTEEMDPVTFSISPELSNERNTTGMFGGGYLELLAREMTAELQQKARRLAPQPGWHTITSKGVSFDILISQGQVVDARGIDIDLIVKPFGAGGTKPSLRQFTVDASNRHHGMEAEERFDIYLGDPDFDGDGVTRELSIGDVTELTIWQATLDMPQQELPEDDPDAVAQINAGLQTFKDVGCGSCHLPEITLNNRTFCEPGPYNPPGYFSDTSQAYCTILDYSADDATKTDSNDDNAPPADQPLVLTTYTDLKRHTLCDRPTDPNPIRDLCNEQLPEGRPDQGDIPGQEFFLTADLWQVGESAPFGHNGYYPSLSSIIMVHAGEARASRDAYAALSDETKMSVIKFLRSLKLRDQPLRINDG